MSSFIQARHFREMRSRSIDLIVHHSMESPKKPDTAEAVARWFAGATSPVASGHSCVDNDSDVDCVREKDIAFAAPGANHNGFHIEHAGQARQSRAEWLDEYSLPMLRRSAARAAKVVVAHKIPVRFVRAAELLRGVPGVTTHYEVSQAFRKSNHWDPGKGFPIDVWIDLINKAAPAPKPPDPSSQEDEMAYLKIPCPTGGYWLLKTDDGGVAEYAGAPFFGSVAGIAHDRTKRATDLCPYVVDGVVRGYWIVLEDGANYALPENDPPPYLGGYHEHPEWWGGNRIIIGQVQTGGFHAGEIVTVQQLGREPGDPDYVLDRYDLPVRR